MNRAKAIGPMAGITKLLLRQGKVRVKDATIPVFQRGVRLEWLTKFGAAINPDFYSGSDLTTRDVIERVVIPLTKPQCLPLFSYVPDEFRGRPRHFLSHAWNDYFLRPFGFGLISILDYRFRPDDCVWIDFVCHNQHEQELLPEQLQATISRVGSVQFLINEPILFTRSWCIYELLQAHLTKADMQIQVAGGAPDDHIFKAEEAIKNFTSTQRARASKKEDKRAIDREIIRVFGRIENADAVVRTLLSKYHKELVDLYKRGAEHASPS